MHTVSSSKFSQISEIPLDPVFQLTAAYNQDTHPRKVNLGVGAYRSDEEKPWILPVVRRATQMLMEDPKFNHEYLAIEGLKSFTDAAMKLILGDSEALRENRSFCVQSISGTGAVRIGADFLAKFLPAGTVVYGPTPTWGNHLNIFEDARLPYKSYRYLNFATKSLDLDGMLEDLKNAPEKSIILLHGCAHNPTGVDPTNHQWETIAEVMKSKNHFPFFDNAYQGFASGDLDRDAYSVRYFVQVGFELLVAQSFAKNFGLYGERTGSLTVVCDNEHVKACAYSQIRRIIRGMYSSPPAYGARIVDKVLNNPELFNEWKSDLKTMSNRIFSMRRLLYEGLVSKGTPGDWSHIVNQIGMFAYTGLNESQVKVLVETYHIYLLSNGRISIAGLNSKNIDYVIDAIHQTVTTLSN